MFEMHEPKILAMYRIKNEERWIEKSLKYTSEVCKAIVILDDGSTDNTLEICKSFDKVVSIYHQSNLPMDVIRDDNKLLEMAMKLQPEFLLRLDGDEIISPHAQKILFEELTVLYPEVHVLEFQCIVIWDKPNQYRYDGLYSNMWIPKLIRMKNQPKNLFYSGSKLHGNGTHIPSNAIGRNESIRSKVKIFHYGNYDEELRQKKYKFYTSIDPNNKEFDNYIHVIAGKGKFSGPIDIELRSLPKGQFIENIN